MGPEENSDISVWKKRKTLVKQLMALGLSRNDAEEEAKWIKLGRKLYFSGKGFDLFSVEYSSSDSKVVDKLCSLGLN